MKNRFAFWMFCWMFLLAVTACEEESENRNIEIETPNELTTWIAGEGGVISWNGGENKSNISIDLFCGDEHIDVIVGSIYNDGDYYYSIPENITTSENFIVRIKWGESEFFSAPFRITNPENLIIEPVFGTVWHKADSTATVQWQPGLLTDSIQVILAWGLSESEYYVSGYVPDTGAYTFPLGDSITADDGYKIILKTSTNDKISSPKFTIVNELKVRNPDENTVWFYDRELNVEWTESGISGSKVSIDLYKDGQYVQPVITRCSDMGHKLLNLTNFPSSYESGDEYQFKINNLTYGESAFSENFKICDEIKLTSHLLFIPGRETEITWDDANCGGNVSLVLKRYNGSDSLIIAESIPNNGTFVYPVPEDIGLPDYHEYHLMLTHLESGNKFSSSQHGVWRYTAPDMLEEFYPENGAMIESPDIELRWRYEQGNHFFAEQLGIIYRLFIGTAPELMELSYQTSDLTCSFYDLDASTTYYWKIFVSDKYGNETEGPMLSFTTPWMPNTPPENPSHGDEWTVYVGQDQVPLEMIFIEGGSFMMGSDEGDLHSENNEYPCHEVTISNGFWIGKYEVTQAQWEAVTGQDRAYFSGHPDWPVESISWNDVSAFVGNINSYDQDSYWRMPTEAEWEYACRAGEDETRFWWGDDNSYEELENYAWYNGNSGVSTHTCGSKNPNPWNLYDMLGNVAELCSDWYASNYYQLSPSVDPQGPTSGNFKVVRGGSYLSNTFDCLMAGRAVEFSYENSTYTGFRLVRDSD